MSDLKNNQIKKTLVIKRKMGGEMWELMLNNLIPILTANEKELLYFIEKRARDKDLPVLTDPDNYFYIHKADNNICLVAHIDTYFSQKPKNKDIIRNGYELTTNGIGLGADDRAGVYILLEFISDPNYNLLFTNYEETGRQGIRKALQEEKICTLLSKNTCFIELDRKGHKNFVYYTKPEEEFIRIFKEFGWREEEGTSSDIKDISKALGIASVNLAVGFYNAHIPNEYLNLAHLADTIDLLKNESLVKKLKERQYKDYEGKAV